MITYTIQGFDLHQPDVGFQLLEGSSFAPPIAPRRVNLTVPRMHGQVPLWDDELDAAKLALRVRIKDTDPEQLQFKWEHLRALMWTGSNQGLTVRRESGVSGSQQITSTFAQLESMTEPDFFCAAGIVDTVIMLNIPSGRWQSIQTFEQTLTTTNQSVAFAAESTAPVSNMLVRVQGPLSSTGAWVEVHDETSQTGFRILPGLIIDDTEYILVDPENFRAWHNTTDDWDAEETDVSGGLEARNMGMLTMVSIPSFQLGVRTNDTRRVRSVGATATTIVVRGRRTYI
jgi:hypothetical protein